MSQTLISGAPALHALDGLDMNVGFARAVVECISDGELWCDRAESPRAFHAVHECGMSLVWGPDVAGAFDDVVARIRERAAAGLGEWLQVEPRWTELGPDALDWDGAFGAVSVDRCLSRGGALLDEVGRAVAAVRRTRLNFAFDAAAFGASCHGLFDGGLPAAVTVRPAVGVDLTWDGGTVPGHFWSDVDAFLAAGGGAVAEVGGVPAAVAFASFRTGDDVEIGIETVPAFRRRGLARVACAAFIADLVARGLVPVWSCREDNTGSLRLAESLGFAVSRRLPYYEVRATLGG